MTAHRANLKAVSDKSSINHKEASQSKSTQPMHNARQQEYYRRLDRVLAARYVQECMLRRDGRSRAPHTQTRSDQPQVWQPRMLVHDDPSSTRISATLELPGLEKNDLVIDREGDKLIVSGQRKSPIPTDMDPTVAAAQYPVQELKYGKYRRAIDLAPGTLASTLSFMLKDGMLVITWPRAAAVHRSRAPVEGSQAQTAPNSKRRASQESNSSNSAAVPMAVNANSHETAITSPN
ncbi:hypothetical protein FIBSPDRAFT_851585 [Athelia psychrophila]|uniref:SHSP domain-containing protein n=1 Tax=Athelia psychrophila TaxID=1759441 RepID=A0A166SAM7_9AGAM|nr:hypothetical protein FIBSPDRAFT_851585 [Fibularhizoctonia sp. CBS 109695]